MVAVPRQRWAVFTRSTVSSLDNPDAYLARALARQLRRLGHEAYFYEERGNPALLALLRSGGVRALDAFRAEHPEVAYRTYEPRSGADLVEWLTRTLATVDIALVLAGTPAPVARWVGRLTRAHLRTYLIDTGWGTPPSPEYLAEIEPAGYALVIVASESLAERYRTLVPAGRIRLLEKLPQTVGLTEPDASAARNAAAIELLEIVRRNDAAGLEQA